MKKWILGIWAALLFCVPVFAHPPITVYVDGEALSFDQPPIIQEDRTLVPMRSIFQALGAEVMWDEPSQTVTAMNMEDVILFRVGHTGLFQNGELIYTMPVPAQIVNDRLLVPLRAVAESMGAEVGWDGVNYVVTITSEGGAPEMPPTDMTEDIAAQMQQTEPEEGGFATEIKAPDGTVVLTAKLECDVVSGSGSGVKKINTAMANETFAMGQGFIREYAEAALSAYAAQGDGFMPYYTIGAFELTREEDGYVSFLASLTAYDGSRETVDYRSYTYALSDGEKQELSDLVSDSREELEALWLASFGALIEEMPEAFYDNAEQRLERNLSKVNFYLTEDGIAFYLSPDTIAPVETGAVSFEVKYDFE